MTKKYFTSDIIAPDGSKVLSEKAMVDYILNDISDEIAAKIFYAIIIRILDANEAAKYETLLKLSNYNYIKVVKSILKKSKLKA